MENIKEEEDIKLSFRDGISHFACVVPPPPSFFSARHPAPPDAAAAAARPQNRAKSKSKAQSLSSGALDGGGGGSAEDDSSRSRGRPTAAPVQSTTSPNNRRSMRLEESRLKRASARSQKKPKRGYAAPEVYAHLGGVPDYVEDELDVLFCGINPGYMTAVKGHHYANPTNHFWRCLHLSGFTPRLLSASEDSSLPGTYNLGLTNLLARPSTSITELSKQEMANSVPALLAKVLRLRPRVVCFVGKGIWLHVERSLQLQTGHEDSDDDAGASPDGLVARANETSGVMKEEDMDDYSGCTPSVSAQAQARQVKTEPGLVTNDASTGKELKGDVTRRHTLAVREVKVKETSDTAPSPLMTTGPRSASRPRRATGRSVFAYGLQPYKALHDVVPENASVRETLFYVFPSTSGRVVSHQLKDKVKLFKMLKQNLEPIKAGNIDTSTMSPVRL